MFQANPGHPQGNPGQPPVQGTRPHQPCSNSPQANPNPGHPQGGPALQPLAPPVQPQDAPQPEGGASSSELLVTASPDEFELWEYREPLSLLDAAPLPFGPFVACNGCLSLPEPPFSFTQCGHLTCKACLEKANQSEEDAEKVQKGLFREGRKWFTADFG